MELLTFPKILKLSRKNSLDVFGVNCDNRHVSGYAYLALLTGKREYLVCSAPFFRLLAEKSVIVICFIVL